MKKKTARQRIYAYLTKQHKKGIYKCSIIDIILATKTTPITVEKVMSTLEKQRKVKEIN